MNSNLRSCSVNGPPRIDYIDCEMANADIDDVTIETHDAELNYEMSPDTDFVDANLCESDDGIYAQDEQDY